MAGFLQVTRLLRGLSNGQVAKAGPFYVTVDITRECNLSCPGCRYHSPYARMQPLGDPSVRNMPMPLFQRLCDELHSMGTTSMTISGEGEPFLHPHLLEMVALAKDRGITLSVFTNGTRITREAVHALIDSRLDVLKISLWASSKEAYEENHLGSPTDAFDRVKASLRLIADLKVRRKSRFPLVKLHQPIDRRNWKSIARMLGIAKETGCNVLSFSPFKTQDHMFASLLPSRPEMEQVRTALLELKREIRGLPMGHTIDTTLLRYEIGGEVWKKLPCYIGWLHARIKPDGNVLACNNYLIPMGNLNKEKMADIWNGPGFRQFRKQGMTLEGLTAIASCFDCYFCCHVSDNFRVHRRYRWIAPFLGSRP